jgi:hypothetical protein
LIQGISQDIGNYNPGGSGAYCNEMNSARAARVAFWLQRKLDAQRGDPFRAVLAIIGDQVPRVSWQNRTRFARPSAKSDSRGKSPGPNNGG